MAPPKRVAVVTGGTRGLGYFGCRDLARPGLAVVMGSRDEPRGEAVAELVWLATLSDGGPSGGFFRGRQRIAW